MYRKGASEITITNCPKCGSMNITTAGVCANCGWSQFAQVTTVSTRITGEIEIMLSGKALLDDYKRLLFENRNLKERVAELEAERRWIPVSERLPEVYRDEDGEFIPFLVCENDKDFPYRALYDGLNWGDGMFVADVTHWMPLPKLPEVTE